VFCLLVVLVRLSVPVQVIDWKDSSPRMTCNVLMGTLNPIHSLAHSVFSCYFTQAYIIGDVRLNNYAELCKQNTHLYQLIPDR